MRVYSHCPFACAAQNEAIAAILILSLVFYLHTVLAAVVSDFWPFCFFQVALTPSEQMFLVRVCLQIIIFSTHILYISSVIFQCCSMLDPRHKREPNIKTTLAQRAAFDGLSNINLNQHSL